MNMLILLILCGFAAATASISDTEPVRPIEVEVAAPVAPAEAEPAPAEPAEAIAAVTCDLRYADGMIVAMASAVTSANGTFALEVQSHGSSTIRSRQAGVFDLEAGETAELARLRLGVNGQSVTGTLTVDWEGGADSCLLE